MADAMVGGVDGDADAPVAGEPFAACAKAEAAESENNAAVSNREVLRCFMGFRYSSTKELVRVIGKKRDEREPQSAPAARDEDCDIRCSVVTVLPYRNYLSTILLCHLRIWNGTKERNTNTTA